MEISNFSKKIGMADQIGSGQLFVDSPSGPNISEELDRFCLHDALLFRYEFDNHNGVDSILSISGLLPNFENVFELSFHGVDCFESCHFKFTGLFSVEEARLIHAEQKAVRFSGEFEGQFFSFSFDHASFIKRALRIPVTRNDLGW